MGTVERGRRTDTYLEMSLENIQREMRSLVRSGSLRLTKLIKPLSSEHDHPSSLPITRSFPKTEKTQQNLSGPTPPSTDLIQYSPLLQLVTCPVCSHVVSPHVSQCRKGHLYCSTCRTNNTCRICKQTFSEAPNTALEKIISLVALPCKYSPQGCPCLVFQPSRAQHQTVCIYRPVPCQWIHQGCEEVASLKDMSMHHKLCPYAHQTSMPCRQEQKAGVGAGGDVTHLSCSQTTNEKLVEHGR